jgi:tetratricopeptide (TPR) repeat protein
VDAGLRAGALRRVAPVPVAALHAAHRRPRLTLPARVPWWLGLWGLAAAARLLYRFGADEPLLFSHQYHYWEGALRILEHPQPLTYILTSDQWREWPLGGPWTIAPLYHLFLAALLAVSGTSLTFVLVVQSLLDAAVAVAVGHLGERAAGSPRGRWAGVAYALYWYAIQLCNSTMTEALHTPLLALAFVLLARLLPERDGDPPAWRAAFLAGLVFGLGGLARTVGLAFVGPAALLLLARYRRRGVSAAVAFVLAAALPIVPWAVRNRVLLGDPSPIESASVANLFIDNVYVDEARYARMEHFVFKEKTPAARRDVAMAYVKDGLRKRWRLIPAKVRHNATHLLRPEGLWILLGVQQAWPAWRHALNLALDDVWLVLAVPLFLAWLAAGRGWLRAAVLAWTALYLFLIVVVFHAEIRYRLPLVPYALAGAAGGWAVLRERRRAAWIAAAAGALLVALVVVRPFAGPAWRAGLAFARLQGAAEPMARGDFAAARSAAWRAAAADPTSMWPWIRYGRWLAGAGRYEDALDAYTRAAPLREVPWEPTAVRPALLAAAGRADEARAAAGAANRMSLAVDSWILLDVAWRATGAPVTDEIAMGGLDYGAARDFMAPRGGQRWSRPEARLRFRPRTVARAYELVLDMGMPAPGPESSDVSVEVDRRRFGPFAVSRAFAEQRVRIDAPADGVIDVVLRAPSWSRTGQPAAQGIALRGARVIPY